MKSMHRIKALTSYDGARLTLKADMAYPSYMLLKEAARGILAYIAENDFESDISEKMKLRRLLDLVDHLILPDEIKAVEKLIEIESKDFKDILSVDINELRNVKKQLKVMIWAYLGERV